MIKIAKKIQLNKKNIVLLSIILILLISILLIVFYVEESKQKGNIPKIDGNVSNIFDKNIGDSKLKPKNVDAVVPIFMYHFVRDDTRKL